MDENIENSEQIVKKAITHYPVHHRNPFADTMVFEKRKKMVHATGFKRQQIVDDETGEVTGHTQMVEYREVDREKFVKLYSENMRFFFDLSKSEMACFMYLLHMARKDKDMVQFVLSDASAITGIKDYKTINKAVCKLIAKNIIARTETQSVYFINPSIFFNGNRATFVKEIRSKDEMSNSELGMSAIKHLKGK